MKRIQLTTVFLIMIAIGLIPFGTIQAEKTNGLLEMSDFNITKTANVLNIENMFDNDLETYGQLKGNFQTLTLQLKKPQGLKVFIVNGDSSMIIRARDGNKVVASMGTITGQNSLDLTNKNITELVVQTTGTSTPGKLYEILIYKDSTIHDGDIQDFQTITDDTSVTLSWDKIDNSKYDISKLKIYRDNKLIKTVNSDTTNYKDEDSIKPDTDYKYKITWVFSDGYETEGIEKTVRSGIEKPIYIKNVKATASQENIKLSWDRPDKAGQVELYRNGVLINKATYTLNSFEDKGLIPGKEYIYTFKVISSTGKVTETEEETKVKTLEETKPVIKEADFNSNYNGDYAITWKEPVTGKIQILIGGQIYTEVNAANQTYKIPAKDVKYTTFGDPDIVIKPVGKYGRIGEPVTAPREKGKIPFTARDLILSGNSLFWYLSPLVLLALAFLIYEKIRRTIVKANTGDQGKERTKEREKQSKEEQKTKQEKIEKNKRLKERQEKEQRKLKKELSKLDREVKKVEKLPKEKRAAKQKRIRQSTRQPKTQRETNLRSQRDIRQARETREPRARDRRA